MPSYLSELVPRELAPCARRRLPGIIGPVPPPLWIRAPIQFGGDYTTRPPLRSRSFDSGEKAMVYSARQLRHGVTLSVRRKKGARLQWLQAP